MISLDRELQQGVAMCRLDNRWRSMASRLDRVFLDFYGSPAPVTFYPHFNEVTLRRALLEGLPELADFSEGVSELWDRGFPCLLFDALHVAGLKASERARALISLGLALGYPTPRGARSGRLICNVCVKSVPAYRPATYSEHKLEADLHTDSQFFPTPERCFVLYCARPAPCGGGASTFVSARSIEEVLSTMDRAELRQVEIPFRFHEPFFCPEPHPATPRLLFATLLGDSPTIRYRHDVIAEGLSLAGCDRTIHAHKIFRNALARVTPTVIRLERDAAAICDNHAALHGRHSFEDESRLLMRIRIAEEPVAVQVARFLERQPSNLVDRLHCRCC